jgi:hypothetical protein
MSVYLGDKKASKINLITNQKDLPDWDDNSPIIASGIGYYNTTLWELTEKGTMRWKYNPDGTGTSVYKYCAGWNNTVTPATQPLDYLLISSKIRQIDIGENFNTIYLGYATNCERIRFPNTIGQLGLVDFCSLKEIDISEVSLSSLTLARAFNLRKVTLNQSMTEISSNRFLSARQLQEINLDNITVFGNSCFEESGLYNMDLVFNKNLVSIGIKAFYRSKIKSVTFQNSIDSLPTIGTYAFSQCDSLTDIYCPWEEGAIANAPWGATNATIHYNWVEEVTTDAED